MQNGKEISFKEPSETDIREDRRTTNHGPTKNYMSRLATQSVDSLSAV